MKTDATAASFTRIANIVYSKSSGERGVGDLLLPEQQTSKPPVLLIHGGGWGGMSKEALDPVARWFVGNGRAVFNINYRLLGQAPWPACGDDCIAAGRFILNGELASHGLATPERILTCGASAGGHLAMTTGLSLPARNVEAIVPQAGPSRMDRLENDYAPALNSSDFLLKFFGTTPTPEMIEQASPALSVKPGAPPLFCIHSRNDKLVFPMHSEEAVTAWRKVGSLAELFLFDGRDTEHGLWDNSVWDGVDVAARTIFEPVNLLMHEVLKRLDSL